MVAAYRTNSHKSGKRQRKDRTCFSLHLNVDNVRDDVTSGSKLFHVLAAATGNARSPRRVDGMGT